MRPTVFLWDIDGTLVSTSGVGRRAVERSLLQRLQRADVLSFALDGMTDRAIMRQALVNAGLPEDDDVLLPAIEAQLQVYIECWRKKLWIAATAACFRVSCAPLI